MPKLIFWIAEGKSFACVKTKNSFNGPGVDVDSSTKQIP